jgi:hypothetical protein
VINISRSTLFFFLTKRGGCKEQTTLKYIKQRRENKNKMEGAKPKLHYYVHNLKQGIPNLFLSKQSLINEGATCQYTIEARVEP